MRFPFTLSPYLSVRRTTNSTTSVSLEFSTFEKIKDGESTYIHRTFGLTWPLYMVSSKLAERRLNTGFYTNSADTKPLNFKSKTRKIMMIALDGDLTTVGLSMKVAG